MLHFDPGASTSTLSDLTQCTLHFVKKVQTSYVLVDSCSDKKKYKLQTVAILRFGEILDISNYDAKWQDMKIECSDMKFVKKLRDCSFCSYETFIELEI